MHDPPGNAGSIAGVAGVAGAPEPAQQTDTRATPGVSLEDKYLLASGWIFLSGTQALVRLPLMQRARDLAAGFDTAGFISGYRGSPLGGYDMQLQAAKAHLEAAHIVFQPGLNEDLAATAVWGTQQVNLLPGPKCEGVFAIWYGKGPGVDRSGDPIKHGNRMGTSIRGGVLVVFGDDHPGKSSTVAHQSEQALAANGVPVLYPASVQEYLDFGLHGFALSRDAGVWVGLKCVNETVETTATVNVDPDRLQMRIPNSPLPPDGVHARLAFEPMRDEVRLQRFKLPRAKAYVRMNRLDRVTHDGPRRLLGVVAAGKSWLDVLSALAALDLDRERCASLGVRIYKPAMIWPLEPEGLADFSHGHAELLFVEEKAAFMEPQAAHALYNVPAAARPRIVGKLDEHGMGLLAADVPLDPLDIALVIGRRLLLLGVADETLSARVALLERSVEEARARPSGPLARTPYFCAGCPHNTSTKVPEGSLALGGIGCHTMALGMNRSTLPPTQMGGEGVSWLGIAPFSNTPHVFQNLGDGTYVHSGLLAVRAAVIAGANVTYKILVNDAVAMTGGQSVEGHFSVAEITQQLRAERVQRIAVVSDDVRKHRGVANFASGVTVHDRSALEEVQRELRAVSGVSVLIYEQTCAAEKRRREKRKPRPAVERRIFINERVCEGCGDCSVQSNCVSIEPAETTFGRKRAINQSGCNKDYSCTQGFCPSFVVIEGPGLRAPAARTGGFSEIGDAPEPPPPTHAQAAILVTGIGGTGVVTIGAVLGMASHLEGLGASVYDMTGLAQKGGSVFSHVRIGRREETRYAARVGLLGADLVIGCDLVTTASSEALGVIARHRTRVLLNTHLVPTAAFQQNPNLDLVASEHVRRINDVSGDDALAVIDATEAAEKILGDRIGANMLMVGYALQAGLLPLSVAAVRRAIELNGVAIPFNLRALALGRFAAHDPNGLRRLLCECDPSDGLRCREAEPVDALVAARGQELARYQNEHYARRYRRMVERAAAVERACTPGRTGLTEAVARHYFKLLAYKDEYEVARLLVDDTFRAQLDATFAPGYRISYLLAAPLIARPDPRTGTPRKRRFGPWLRAPLALLARLKFLRGSPFDPFGRTAERRLDRDLIRDYESRLEELLGALRPENHALAVKIASLPEQIRGYGHVRRRHIETAGAATRELMERWRSGSTASVEEVIRG